MWCSLVMYLSPIVALLIFMDFFIRNFTTFKIAKSLQSPLMFPIIGSTHFLFGSSADIFEALMKLVKQFKNGFAFWSFGVFIHFVYSADSVEKILKNRKNTEKTILYKLILQPLLSEGLITSNSEKWFTRRKLLAPAFSFNIMNEFQLIINDQADILTREIREKELDKPEGTHLQKLISRFTLNVICGSAMGIKIKKIDELDDYRSRIDEFGKLIIGRITNPIMAFDLIHSIFGKGKNLKRVIKQARSFTGKIIAQKRDVFIQNQRHTVTENESSPNMDDVDCTKRQQLAVLDTLLSAEQNQNRIDSDGIQEEVDTFVHAGFDTTMTAITFTLFALAHHDDVQKRLYEEISSMEPNQSYNNMKYLDAVMKESLRFYTPVPVIGRTLAEDTEIDGVKIPAKTEVHILVSALHRNPESFPNPDTFDPDRFFNNEVKNPFAFVPFGGGQRICIGQKFAMMEMRTAVGEIIKNFEIRPITKPEDVVILVDIVLRSKDPIRVQFIPRVSKSNETD